MRLILTPLAAIMTLALLSCGGPDAANDQPNTVESARITSAQAGEVISDAMLAASQALYYAITTAPDGRAVTSPDGRLHLSWSEDASFLSGAGTYMITLDEYSVPSDYPFADHYVGYVLTGTIVMRSAAGQHTELAFDLQSSHPNPRLHPASTVKVELSGFSSSEDAKTIGSVLVNGQEFAFADLAAAF
jgi:hypothetical protein